MFSKKIKKKTVILIDYENIALTAVNHGKIVDFEKLRKQCLKLAEGEIILSLVFISDDFVNKIPPDINSFGFEIMLCPKRRSGIISSGTDKKSQDKVDVRLTQVGQRFLQLEEIGTVIVVTHDSDMTDLINTAKDTKKKIKLFGIDKRISFILKKLMEEDEIEPLPFKDE